MTDGSNSTDRTRSTDTEGSRGFHQRAPMILALVFFGCAAWTWGLGWKHFYDAMETSRAVVAREMLRSGSYSVPVLDGQPYLVKPPLFYWTILGASGIFDGVDEFTTRLPSALSAIALVVVVFLLLDGPFSRNAAFVAAVATGTNLLVHEKAVSGQVNMMFGLWVAVSLLLLLRFRLSERPTRWFLLSVTALGLALLTKGPPALLFWVPVLLLFLWRDGALERLRSPALLLGLPLLALIILPWPLLVVHRYGWEESVDVFMREVFARTREAGESNRGPWWFYLVNLPGALMPWMLFIPLVFWRSYDEKLPRETVSALRLCRVGLIASVLLFSIPQARELRYLLPIVPLGCALGAHPVCEARERLPRRWMGRWIATCWLVFALVLLAAPVAAAVVIRRQYQLRMPLPLLVGVSFCLFAGGICTIIGARLRSRRLLIAAGLMVSLLGLRQVELWLTLAERNARKSPVAAIREARHLIGDEALYLLSPAPQPLRWYLDAPLVYSEEPEELLEQTPVYALAFGRDIHRMLHSDGVSRDAADIPAVAVTARDEPVLRLLRGGRLRMETMQTWRVGGRKLLLVQIARAQGTGGQP